MISPGLNCDLLGRWYKSSDQDNVSFNSIVILCSAMIVWGKCLKNWQTYSYRWIVLISGWGAPYPPLKVCFSLSFLWSHFLDTRTSFLSFISPPHFKHFGCLANASSRLVSSTFTGRDPAILQARDEHIRVNAYMMRNSILNHFLFLSDWIHLQHLDFLIKKYAHISKNKPYIWPSTP